MLQIHKRTEPAVFDKAYDICRVNRIYRGDGLESVIRAMSGQIADEEFETSSVMPTNHENTRGSAQ